MGFLLRIAFVFFILGTWQQLSAQCIITVKCDGLKYVTVTNLETKESVQVNSKGDFTLTPEWENKQLLFSAIGKKDTIVKGTCGNVVFLRDQPVQQKTVTIASNSKYFKEVIDNSDLNNLFIEGFYTAEIEEISNPNKRYEVINASISHMFSSTRRLIPAIKRVGIDSCRYCYERSFRFYSRVNMSSDLNNYHPSYWFLGEKIKFETFTRLGEVNVYSKSFTAYIHESDENNRIICLIDTVNKIIASYVSIENKTKGLQLPISFNSFLSKSYFIGQVVNKKLEPAYIGLRSYIDRIKNKTHAYNFHFYRYNTPMQKSSLRIPLFGLQYWGEGIEPRFRNLSCKTDCNVSIDAKPPKPTYMAEEERLAYIKVLDELAAKYITINWEIKKPVSGVNWDFK